jgi:hypothetical protein
LGSVVYMLYFHRKFTKISAHTYIQQHEISSTAPHSQSRKSKPYRTLKAADDIPGPLGIYAIHLDHSPFSSPVSVPYFCCSPSLEFLSLSVSIGRCHTSSVKPPLISHSEQSSLVLHFHGTACHFSCLLALSLPCLHVFP